MKIILLRHAESVSNKTNLADSLINSGLSKKGMKDSYLLVSKLKDFKIDVFFVSPLKRNIQTLEPFLDTLKNSKVIKSKLTLERNLGSFTGTPIGTFQEFCEERKCDRVFFRPPNGESIVDVYERAKKFLSYLKNEFSSKAVLVCGHKNFLMCLEILIRKLDIKDFYKYSPLENSEIRVFDI